MPNTPKYILLQVAPSTGENWSVLRSGNAGPNTSQHEEEAARLQSLRRDAPNFDPGQYIYVRRNGDKLTILDEFRVAITRPDKTVVDNRGHNAVT